jgi:hypothetical protein
MSVMTKPSVEKSLVKKILEHPLRYDWTLQGLGMLRLYLDDERRMHVWDDRYSVDDVSQMHTHPWNFESFIVAGEVTNQLYHEVSNTVMPEGSLQYNKQKIFCGTGGGLIGEPEKTWLAARRPNTYGEGCTYYELADEIHISNPKRGTVTIVTREFLADNDHAYVFWKNGDWVSAEPRPATKGEIVAICDNSLDTWFN